MLEKIFSSVKTLSLNPGDVVQIDWDIFGVKSRETHLIERSGLYDLSLILERHPTE